MKCFAWRFLEWLKRVAQISLRKLGLDWSLREREREVLSSRKVDSRCFQNRRVANRAEGVWGPLIAPRRNLPVGVSEAQTCLGWGQTCLTTASRTRPEHRTCLVFGLILDEGWGTGHVRSRDRICLRNVFETRQRTQISPAKYLAVAKELIEHVQSRSWTCPVKLTGTRQ